MEQRACRGTAKPKMAEEFCTTRAESYVRAQLPLISQNYTRFSPIFRPEKSRSLCNSLQALVGTASDAGLARSIRNRRSKHHGAKSGRTSGDSELIARSRNCTDSLRCPIGLRIPRRQNQRGKNRHFN